MVMGEEAGGGVVERRRPPVARVAVATAIDVAAAVVVVAGQLTARALFVGLVLHLVASASLALARGLPASRRWLLVAFELTLPIVGAPVALLSLVGGDHSGLERFDQGGAGPEPAPEVAP